ncbi:MAG: hypothetical protein WCR46_09440 [Deltaproteobacteria bacterium]
MNAGCFCQVKFFWVLPLAIAVWAGANARHSIGTGISAKSANYFWGNMKDAAKSRKKSSTDGKKTEKHLSMANNSGDLTEESAGISRCVWWQDKCCPCAWFELRLCGSGKDYPSPFLKPHRMVSGCLNQREE